MPDLLDDVWLYILSYLKKHDLLKFSLTEKNAKRLSDDNRLWLRLIESDFQIPKGLVKASIEKQGISAKELFCQFYLFSKNYQYCSWRVAFYYNELLQSGAPYLDRFNHDFLYRYTVYNREEKEKRLGTILISPREDDTPAISFLNLSSQQTWPNDDSGNAGICIHDEKASILYRFMHYTDTIAGIQYEDYIQTIALPYILHEAFSQLLSSYCIVVNVDDSSLLENTLKLLEHYLTSSKYLYFAENGTSKCELVYTSVSPESLTPDDVKKWSEQINLSEQVAIVFSETEADLFIKSLNKLSRLDGILEKINSLLPDFGITIEELKRCSSRQICSNLSMAHRQFIFLEDKPDDVDSKAESFQPEELSYPPIIVVAEQNCFNEVLRLTNESTLPIAGVIQGDFDLRKIENLRTEKN